MAHVQVPLLSLGLPLCTASVTDDIIGEDASPDIASRTHAVSSGVILVQHSVGTPGWLIVWQAEGSLCRIRA